MRDKEDEKSEKEKSKEIKGEWCLFFFFLSVGKIEPGCDWLRINVVTRS